MRSKDYKLKVLHTLPKPSANAQLKYKLVTQKGNTYDGVVTVKPLSVGDSMFASISFPWKTINAADTLTLAQTLFSIGMRETVCRAITRFTPIKSTLNPSK